MLGNLFAEVMAGVATVAECNPGLAAIFYKEIHFAIPVFNPTDRANPDSFRPPLKKLAEALNTELHNYDPERGEREPARAQF